MPAPTVCIMTNCTVVPELPHFLLGLTTVLITCMLHKCPACGRRCCQANVVFLRILNPGLQGLPGDSFLRSGSSSRGTFETFGRFGTGRGMFGTFGPVISRMRGKSFIDS
jgi:hypothetical protein